MQSDIIFVEKCECECVWLGKVSVIVLSLAIHVFHPKVLFSYLILLPQKSSPQLIFLAAPDRNFSPSFPTLVLVLCFFLLRFLHGSPPSLTKTKYPSLKKKLKG